ncbi:LysR family transcriptional regulator [Mucilaginibacter conchicola]|uniref:LysR family transcriptional regulator n=1 Tax=Mucilaginibacter conchicola TaxID=2303333 RepID=A0A372NU27_9SPHI|nr:LysR substrate-binding domain-containing protein [Mucilaginibacter conchicola]RFZ92494.1 LysR family transcriptional regulator [Mucilaginibacter conchicola]
MELRQLRYFIKAKELLNFTEAANQLFISQSTLSQQIKQLEDELGTPLFNRVGKHVYITEAGSLFYDYALQALSKANDGLQLLKDINGLHAGRLSIGTTYGLRHILTPAILKFHKAYPQINLEVVFGTSQELTHRLEKFELDFVLTFEEVTHRPDIKHQPLFDSELGFIVEKRSPLAKLKTISLKEILDHELALPAKGYSTRRFVDEVFAKNKLTPRISVEINDIPTLLDLIETGNWHTILTHTTVQNAARLVSVPIKAVKGMQHAAIISMKEVYEKRAVKAFYDILLKAGT